MSTKFNSIILLGFITFACSTSKQKSEPNSLTNVVKIQSSSFGNLPSGEEVTQYTMTNINGLKLSVINFGATITAISVPDKNGNIEDVVLGFDNLEGYLGDHPYMGVVVGRYANRIANASFNLNDTTYTLAKNNGKNSLHGGTIGFDKVLWEGSISEGEGKAGVELRRLSTDMEEGYPGNLDCTVTYSLTNQNQLIIDYKAETDKKTVVNLTNHSYFNLTGDASNTILNHELELVAHGYLPVDETLIPTGELRPVENTPFDFLVSTKIGERIDDDDEQLKFGNGYDHSWIFNEQNNKLKYAGTLYEPNSGRMMTFFTTEVAVQLYCGNFLNGSTVGKKGMPYQNRTGLCLETQHYPDSPNQPDFPTTVLEPGEEYSSQTIYEFSVINDE